MSKPSKGMISLGTTDIHGKLFHPTWTKLAITAYGGDNRVYLQESVNWEPGMEVVIMTSVWEDFEDNHQNERMTIVSVGNSSWTTNNVLYFGNDTSNRLNYSHYVGEEYQTEVMLISRNIKFIGVDSDEDGPEAKFGGHTQVSSGSTATFFNSILLYNYSFLSFVWWINNHSFGQPKKWKKMLARQFVGVLADRFAFVLIMYRWHSAEQDDFLV